MVNEFSLTRSESSPQIVDAYLNKKVSNHAKKTLFRAGNRIATNNIYIEDSWLETNVMNIEIAFIYFLAEVNIDVIKPRQYWR